MSKHADYLREADQCQQMADRTNSPEVKQRWLTLAGRWLGLATETKDNGAAKFDAMVHDRATGQESSNSSN